MLAFPPSGTIGHAQGFFSCAVSSKIALPAAFQVIRRWILAKARAIDTPTLLSLLDTFNEGFKTDQFSENRCLGLDNGSETVGNHCLYGGADNVVGPLRELISQFGVIPQSDTLHSRRGR